MKLDDIETKVIENALKKARISRNLRDERLNKTFNSDNSDYDVLLEALSIAKMYYDGLL